MPAYSAQRSHSHLKVMDIFRTLGSGSLSVTAMLDFSGKANTSIHGLGEDDTATNKLPKVDVGLMLSHRLRRGPTRIAAISLHKPANTRR